MSRVEVIVATMHQKDFSLFEEMNIQTDVIFCNQCDENKFEETVIDGCRVRMLSTNTRGSAVNRNLGMQMSKAEICIFADDDITYFDGYEKMICDAFDKYKKPVIIFNFESSGRSKMSNYTKKNATTKRTFGAPRIAYKNASIEKQSICFCDVFGAGAKYSCGEDSLFCRLLHKNKNKFFRVTTVIGNIHYGESTWFNGYTDKYFFDKGALCKAAYPRNWRLLKYYYIFNEYKDSKKRLSKLVKLYNDGASAFKLNMSYDEYYKNNKEKKCKH